jgi:raffinose/stachyose/melibiose transport system permease protein
LVLYAFVVLVPTVQGGYMSLTDWSALSGTRDFVGFDNYSAIADSASSEVVVRTLVIAAATMVIQNVLGLMLALTLHGRVLGRNVLRTLIFAPVVVSPLVCGYLFQYIFGPPGTGVLNDLLKAIGLSGQQRVWLGESGTALTVVVIVICWQFTGIAMVIYLAGLQSVPKDVIEAAQLDGAGSFRRFWYVTRPMLAPAFTVNLMLSLIGGLQIFDQIYSTTAGGPAGTTETISTEIYRQFTLLGAYGRSAALAVVLAIVVAVLSLVQFFVLRRRSDAL